MSRHVLLSERRLLAMRTLIDVLQHPHASVDSVAWRERVLDAAAQVVPVQRSGFLLPDTDPAVVARGIEPELQREYVERYARHDPAPRRMRELGRGACGQSVVFSGALRETEVFRRFIVPNGMEGGALLAEELPNGRTALLFLHHDRLRDPDEERRAVTVLDTIYPAFRAGLRSWYRRRQRRAVQREMVKLVHDPAAVVDPKGRVLQSNPPFEAWLQEQHAGTSVPDLLARLLAHTRRGESAPAVVEQQCSECSCELRALPLAESDELSDACVVTVRVSPLRRLDAGEIAARFQLTTRQAEVAVLLAQGMGAREVADRLVISWHTARRHIEAVMSRLRVRSRAEVAARLLRG